MFGWLRKNGVFIVVEQPPGEKSPLPEESLFRPTGPSTVLELLPARQRVR